MNRFYISLFFLFMAMTSSAQEQISGIIVGYNSKPIEFATILQLSADSTAIEGTVSDNNGKFKLIKDTNAKLLKVSYIGYQNRIINLPLKKDTIHLFYKSRTATRGTCYRSQTIDKTHYQWHILRYVPEQTCSKRKFASSLTLCPNIGCGIKWQCHSERQLLIPNLCEWTFLRYGAIQSTASLAKHSCKVD